MLCNTRDLQSISYFFLAPGLAAWQWNFGFSWPLYGLMLMIWIGIGVIIHNHAHRPMWRNGPLNRFTDLTGSLLQGHPVYVFRVAHNDNHHRYKHGPKDVSRTYRYGGDHNHLLGHVLHPVQVLFAIYPLLYKHLKTAWRDDRSAFVQACAEYLLVAGLWLVLFFLDPGKALVYVLIPQLVCLHWLLGANYLQHAHANGLSQWNYARNFTGAINWAWFNVGYHTAHHTQAGTHWSQLPALHRRIVANIDPRLIESSLLGYMLRTYVLSVFKPSMRSQSLMPSSAIK